MRIATVTVWWRTVAVAPILDTQRHGRIHYATVRPCLPRTRQRMGRIRLVPGCIDAPRSVAGTAAATTAPSTESRHMPADPHDTLITHLVHSGAFAATMAACAASVLNDPAALPADVDVDLVYADYWYHIGRRTDAIVALCVALACDYPTAAGLVVAAVPHEDDPADVHIPAVGVEHLTDRAVP